ncbi:MAG: hypothetical protein ACOCQX_03055 [Candidatus Nanoarchaeia archaeon]
MRNCKALSFDELVESKYIEEGNLGQSRFEDKDLEFTSPDRMFDCCYMTGSEYLFKRARQKFVQELKTPNYSKNILKKIKDRIRQHRSIMNTGKQQYKGKTIQHYDPETGEAFYEPGQGVYSFKQGPLRAVQTSLARDFIKGIKSGNLHENYTFTCKPGGQKQGVVQKLNYLGVRDMLVLDNQALNDINDCYKFFLWGYHVSEANHHNENKTTSHFDKNELKERIEFLNYACSRPFIKL